MRWRRRLVRWRIVQRRRCSGWRMVSPRSVHIKVGSQLRTELGQDLLSRQGGDGVGAEGFDHLISDHQRIFFAPWTRRVMQGAEFQRQAVTMAVNVGVYSARISAELFAVLRSGCLQALFGDCPDPENALLAIVLEGDFANNLGEVPGCRPTHQIHLKKPVLCRDVPLSK